MLGVKDITSHEDGKRHQGIIMGSAAAGSSSPSSAAVPVPTRSTTPSPDTTGTAYPRTGHSASSTASRAAGNPYPAED